MVLPTFYILGAAKAATTYMHAQLSEHPEILMSDPKEPLFFEAEFQRGSAYYQERYFSHWQGQSQIGEARHRNLFLPYIPLRIKELTPDARFLILVRHPIERAYSHWWHWFSKGVETLTFEQAVAKNFARLRSGPRFDTPNEIEQYIRTLDLATGYSAFPTYVDSSHYAEQINRYQKAFGPDRIKIIFFEDIITSSSSILSDVFNFLGVTDLPIRTPPQRNSSTSITGTKMIAALGQVPGRHLIPRSARFMIREIISRRFFRAPTNISPALRTRLLSHYEQHTSALESICNRPLPHWRQ